MKTSTRKPRKARPETEGCIQGHSIRRSIPVAEVDKMLEEQAWSLTKEPTLWDRRVDLITQIHALEEEIELHEKRALNIRAILGEHRRELQSVVKAIGSELSLDHLH